MLDREAAIAGFVTAAGFGGFERLPIAGDASLRRYERLVDRSTGRTAILMDAPPLAGEDVRPFVRVARFLREAGLSAPDILAEDPANGLLVLEDLGDALFARIAGPGADTERALYAAAIDALVVLHARPVPDWLEPYGSAQMTELAAKAYDWYRAGATGDPAPDRRAGFVAAMRAALDAVPVARPVTVLRDYHAENLVWLPDRDGPARVGLLDFQDARSGHPAYDLVSLLEDARRDVGPDLRTAMTDRYVAATGVDAAAFAEACAVMAVQRNLRILFIFARLSLHFGRPRYVDLIPRVWDHIERDLAHPALADVRERVLADLPAPAPAVLEELKAKCATIPHR